MTKANFHEKREARRDRLEAAAERAAGEAESRFKAADGIAERFYGGQPILVGHHSEKRARRDQERMHDHMRAGIAAKDRASKLAGRAAAVGEGGISSDDPDALAQLRTKLAAREARQDLMKNTNAALRKGDDAKLRELGFNDASIAQLRTPDSCGRTGYADYQLKNNNAEIRRLRARIAELERADKRETAERELAGGVRLIENAEANRVQFIFPGKPDDATRAMLKGYGFKWAPSEGAWQRHLNAAGRMYAGFVVEKLNAKTENQ